MAALSDAISRTIDRARRSGTGQEYEHVVLNGPLQQTVVALLEGTRLVEHESEVPASIYILHGAIKVIAADPFVLEGGALHEMPASRRSVVAIQDTVMLLTAVTAAPGADALDGGRHEHVLPTA